MWQHWRVLSYGMLEDFTTVVFDDITKSPKRSHSPASGLLSFMVANIRLIKLFNDSDILKKYAVWLKLKSIHNNSRVYNYSDYKFSMQSGFSRTLISKHIKWFTDNGWVREENDDIVFIASSKLALKYDVKLWSKIKIDKNSTITEIVKSLRYELLKEKQRQFNFNKSISQNQRNPSSVKLYKRAIKFKKLGVIEGNYKVGLKCLSKSLNVSRSTVSRLIKDKCRTVIRKRSCIGWSIRVPFRESGYYDYKGKLFKRECNEYNFI